ncbi:MAG: helix-turn-helix transcriptional regulator [Myxococcales bacterium]|nr:helix-turn-helix transcriptional regulator [Myxococcales bacterium]
MSTPLAGLALVRVQGSQRLWSGTTDTFTVSVILDGASEWRSRGKDRRTAPGGVRLKEIGEHFRTVSATVPSTMGILLITPERLMRHLERALPGRGRMFPSPQLERPRPVSSAYERLERALLSGGTPLEREAAADAVLTALLAAVSQAPAESRTGSRPGAALRRVREHLDAHFAEPITLTELAAIADLHRASLVRMFRNEYGLPPHAYQIERRVEAAQRLLYAGHAGADVAARVGFYDQSHLIRHFRRLVGVTPRQLAARGA